MRDKKERSLFVPGILVAVGVMLCIGGLTFAFLPIFKCDACLGLGTVSPKEYKRLIVMFGYSPDGLEHGPSLECDWCSSQGRVTPLHKWTKDIPPRILGMKATEGANVIIDRFLEERNASE